MSLDVVKENQTNGVPVHLAGDGKYDSPGNKRIKTIFLVK